MPKYSFVCPNGHYCSITLRYSEYEKKKDTQKCPECDEPLKRHIGDTPDIVFKGSGFYKTGG